jgi:DNA-binding NarL/FixJ family response regulator
MARILIADDRESMRTALRASIGTHPGWRVCGETGDGREVVAKAAELHPDLVIVDFRMPGANGIKAGSELSASMPSIPMVMYTLHKTRWFCQTHFGDPDWHSRTEEEQGRV